MYSQKDISRNLLGTPEKVRSHPPLTRKEMLCTTPPLLWKLLGKDIMLRRVSSISNSKCKAQRITGMVTWSPDIAEPLNHHQQSACYENFIVHEKMKFFFKVLM